MNIISDENDTLEDNYDQLDALKDYRILIVDDQKFNIDALLIILDYFVKVNIT